MILQRLAADGDAVLDHQHRLRRTQRIPLDRIRCIGQFEVVIMLKPGKAGWRQGTQPVQFSLLDGDLLH